MKQRVELVALAALFLAPAGVLCTYALALLQATPPEDLGQLSNAHARAFALHSALNALALLVCTPSGLYLILARKYTQDHATRVWMTKLHLVANIAAALLLSMAGMVAFMAKRAAHEKHFVSRHSWTGLSVALLLALNIFQGLLLTFEGKRANWQWRDETHGLVGTLIYVGSAATLAFGVQSESWARSAGIGPELQQRVIAMIVVAHTALLAKMAIGSKASSAWSTPPESCTRGDDVKKMQ